jgi:hypothetical protein
MDGLTYQQVLADLYDDTAKNLLVTEREYEEEDIPAHDKTKPETYEVEAPEEFQKVQGSRQAVEPPKSIPKYTDITTQSVRYNKDVRTQVLSIDSRFRANLSESPTNFKYTPLVPIKNVASIRLSSVEIPNTFYTFSLARGNIFMRVSNPNLIVNGAPAYYDVGGPTRTVGIDDGNYVVDTTNNNYSNNIITIINNQISSSTTTQIGLTLNIEIDTISSKITIRNTIIGQPFDLDFRPNSPFIDRATDWGLGYNLGFRQKFYTGQASYTAEAIPDTIGPNYLFVSLYPDWKVVTHNSPDKQSMAPFAKIVITVPKNDVIYDNGSNTVTKEYWLNQPQDVKTFQIQITDPFEEVIDLAGGEVSLTVELKEIMNPALYEHIRSVLPDQQQEFGTGT